MTRPLHACLAAAMASFALGGAPALAQELAQELTLRSATEISKEVIEPMK